MTTFVTEEARANAEVIADFLRAKAPRSDFVQSAAGRNLSVVEWGEKNFWLPSQTGRSELIRFLPHQKTILGLFFDPTVASALGCSPGFQTLVYSTIKKSGKSTVAGLVARYLAETSGSHSEVYCVANDLEQARGRIYAFALSSIELDPRYQRADKGIANQWRIIEKDARYLPTHSVLRAVSCDYRGEAGANPTATVWSEAWGLTSEASQRLWEELTPVPTRPRSIRYVETYSGFDNESAILNDLEDRVKKEGRRITRDELDALGYVWPFPPEQLLPFFVHVPSRTFAYWDSGPDARRMPWQTPQYYATQEAELRPQAFRRLHLNYRASSEEEFIPIEWWQRLASKLPTLDKKTPIVVGADASVTGDCTALVAVSRDPDDHTQVVQRLSKVWAPLRGQPLDYSQTIEPTLREWCKNYNVVQVAYDQYQLHHLMTNLRNEGVVWCRSFGQQADRSIADKQLFDLIRDRRIRHVGDAVLEEHIANCAAKIPPDDNTRLRLIKKATKSKIDAAVSLSMATAECLRLNL